MRIQYCSDLHLEFEQNSRYLESSPLKVSGEVLILAGDIVPLNDEFLTNNFFRFVSEHYRKVFWVPGNHEFYYTDIASFGRKIQKELYTNIHIVNNLVLEYEDVRFVFSTLWSHIQEHNRNLIEKSVADFESISVRKNRFNVSDFNHLHDHSMHFLRQALQKKHAKTVVVTHHVPSLQCNSAQHGASLLNEAFCVELTEFIENSNANFWIYGHSHYNHKPLYIGNTILLTNQLGYVHLNEHGGFKRNAYFAL